MAKHLVKCFYCFETFDANIEEYVMINSRRYAHKSCADAAEQGKTKEEKDKEQLEKYIKELFGYKQLPIKVKKQIKQYKEEFDYSYSAIYKTLRYWFEVRKGEIEKANGGVGIVPYVIDEARNYWLDIMQAQELNKELVKKDLSIKSVEVHVSPFTHKPIRCFKKHFTFLEENQLEQ